MREQIGVCVQMIETLVSQILRLNKNLKDMMNKVIRFIPQGTNANIVRPENANIVRLNC